jgi:hypothetical protein
MAAARRVRVARLLAAPEEAGSIMAKGLTGEEEGEGEGEGGAALAEGEGAGSAGGAMWYTPTMEVP